MNNSTLTKKNSHPKIIEKNKILKVERPDPKYM